MIRFEKEEIKRFLLAMDQYLEAPAEMILIGGTAALLAYQASGRTQDIDTYNRIEHLQKAYKKAKKVTGINIPLSRSSVADGPHDFESRLKNYNELPLKKLQIKVPEVVDLILMKIIRGVEHDLETIRDLIQKQSVQSKSLVERFEKEMGHVIGDQRRIKQNFLAMLEENYPGLDLDKLLE